MTSSGGKRKNKLQFWKAPLRGANISSDTRKNPNKEYPVYLVFL
jgi:hypothetical protein